MFLDQGPSYFLLVHFKKENEIFYLQDSVRYYCLLRLQTYYNFEYNVFVG